MRLNLKSIQILCSQTLNYKLHKRFLLTTTQIKLLNSYDAVNGYLQKQLTGKYAELKYTPNFQLTLNDQICIKKLELLFDINKRIDTHVQEAKDLRSYTEITETSEGDDDELRKIAIDDLTATEDLIKNLKIQLIDCFVDDELEDKENALLEVNPGVGGQEAMLFCRELFEMYRGYTQYKGWIFEDVDVPTTEIGGVRHASANIIGENVFKFLKFESGVHRVQRVPKTERGGRIHTSTCTVAILPKPKEIKIDVNPKDIKVEHCRSSGPGGQHVNKTESAIRLTHLPTGITVFCQDERHSLQNRKIAMETLKFKLYNKQFEDELTKRERNRRLQVGSASRSERIRTYNYVQDRVTDHRLDESLHNIGEFLTGSDQLNELIESLKYEQSLDLLNEVIGNK